MDFSSPDHTKYVWEQIKELWNDRQKAQGERFVGNNNFSSKSVDTLLNALAENLSSLGSISMDKLNERWSDHQNRNWVKIIFARTENQENYL